MVWLQQSHKRVQSHNCWCCTSARFVDDFRPKCSVPYRSCLGAKWIFPGSTNWLQPGDWSCTEAGAGHALPFSDKPKGSQVSSSKSWWHRDFPLKSSCSSSGRACRQTFVIQCAGEQGYWQLKCKECSKQLLE